MLVFNFLCGFVSPRTGTPVVFVQLASYIERGQQTWNGGLTSVLEVANSTPSTLGIHVSEVWQ